MTAQQPRRRPSIVVQAVAPPSAPAASHRVAKELADVRAQLAELRQQRLRLEAEVVVGKAALLAGLAKADATPAAEAVAQPAPVPVAKPAAVSELDALAHELVVKSAYALSPEQARAKALRLRKDLYGAYLAEHASRTAPRAGTTFGLLCHAREARG